MHVTSGSALSVMDGEQSEMGEGLSSTACMVDWHGNGGRDILYALYPNYFAQGVFLYEEDRSAKSTVPVYHPAKRLAGVMGDYAFALHTNDGSGFSIVAYGVPGRRPGQEDDGGWLKLYRNKGTRSEPYFGGKPERVSVNGQSLLEAIGGTAITIQPIVTGDAPTDLVVGCLFDNQLYWPDGKGGWDYGEHPNMGYGRSYTSEGAWKGQAIPHRIFRLRNIGTNESPRYAAPELIYEYASCYGMEPVDATLLDVDGDGQDELIFRNHVERLYYVKQKGTAFGGASAELMSAAVARSFFQTTLSPCDVDGDGELEILVSGNPGVVFWLDRRGGAWTEMPPLLRHGGDVRAETLSVPCLADMDGDGDLDMVVGDSSGFLWYFENTSGGSELALKAGRRLDCDGKLVHHTAGPTGSIQGPAELRFGYTTPLVMDWDGDGKPDIISNDICGRYTWYRTARRDGRLELTQPVQLKIGGRPFDGAWRARAAAWNADTLAIVNIDGFLQFFQRDTDDYTTLRPGDLVRYVDGCGVRACGPGGWWGRTAFFACDWDGDGRQDLLVGSHMSLNQFFNTHLPRTATVFWLRNTGSNAEPRFERARLMTLRDGTIIDLVCHNCTPWCADLDGDGQLDLIAGAEDGKVYAWLRKDLKWDWDPATRFV